MPYTLKPTKSNILPNKVRTFRDLLRIDSDSHRYFADGMEFPAQCGMEIVFDLSIATKQQQALYLAQIFDEGNRSQIIITDIVGKRGIPRKTDNFYETKRVAMKYKHVGPITTNPNTGHLIRHFTITRDMLVDIYNYKEKSK